ncbi:MAG TPA: ABC transporter ATP-binding protein [Polyangiaceae bacterium]|jgi:NitT/TauT family transport system ATP-binding protein|nr:ABC transporter ATP-binding protein [Polyangiaceae bacterium]
MKLELCDLSKTYHGQKSVVQALAPTSFRVDGGAFVTLLGPSGCGKSTALSLVAGLEEATGGEILLDGVKVTGPGAERGMVFQSYTLFPWLTVLENARFSTRLANNKKRREPGDGDAVDRAKSLLDLMGLGDFANAYPRDLSGGMKQRVAIARALVNRPKVLLMDEPFGALDAQTREEMQELMLKLHAHEGTTVLFVTHDVEEAIYLSTRVLVFSSRPGRLIRDFEVPFGASSERRPELKLSAEFTEWKRELFGLLHPGTASHEGRRALLDRLVTPSSEDRHPS